MFLALMSLIGCELPGTSCTMMFVPNTLTIEATRETWQGDVVVDIEYPDGEGMVCTLLAEETEMTCDDDESAISIQGETLTISMWNHAPDSVRVGFSVDGAAPDSVELFPEYEEYEPNGSGCGVTRTGTVMVAL